MIFDVTCGSLATNEASLGLNLSAVLRTHALDLVVSVDDLEDVQQLTLVLVNALHLESTECEI